jgi:hypothetical protein
MPLDLAHDWIPPLMRLDSTCPWRQSSGTEMRPEGVAAQADQPGSQAGDLAGVGVGRSTLGGEGQPNG